MASIVVGVPATVCTEAFLSFLLTLPCEHTLIVSATDHMLASTLATHLESPLRTDLDYRTGTILPVLRGMRDSTLAVVSIPVLHHLIEEMDVNTQGEETIGVYMDSKKPVFLREYQQYCKETQQKAVPIEALYAPFTPIRLPIPWEKCIDTLKSTINTRLSAVNPQLEDYPQAISSLQAYEPLLSQLSLRVQALRTAADRLSASPTTLSLLHSLSTRLNHLQCCLEKTQFTALYVEKRPSGQLLVINFLWEVRRDVCVWVETEQGERHNCDPFELEAGAQLLDFSTFPAPIASLRLMQAGEAISPVLIWSSGENAPLLLPFQAPLPWQSAYPPLNPPSANIHTFITPQEQTLYGQIHHMLPDITQTDSDFLRFIRVVKTIGDLRDVNRVVEELLSAVE